MTDIDDSSQEQALARALQAAHRDVPDDGFTAAVMQRVSTPATSRSAPRAVRSTRDDTPFNVTVAVTFAVGCLVLTQLFGGPGGAVVTGLDDLAASVNGLTNLAGATLRDLVTDQLPLLAVLFGGGALLFAPAMLEDI